MKFWSKTIEFINIRIYDRTHRTNSGTSDQEISCGCSVIQRALRSSDRRAAAPGGKVCHRDAAAETAPSDHVLVSEQRYHSGARQKKKPRILPPRCFRRASSWSMMPPEVVITM